MTATLPKPLTPPDCDLSTLPSMLLDVQRLRDSGMAHHENADVFRASVLLWCASWAQPIAASLKDDDRELAGLAGFGRFVAEWLKIKADVMAGFVLCADGRWYHPVVAEKALEQYIDRLCRKLAGARGNATQGKVQGNSHADVVALADAGHRLAFLCPKHDLLTKPAVADAMALWPDQEEAAADDGDEPQRTNHERSPSAPRSQSERAPSPVEDAPRTQSVRTANAPRSQSERSPHASRSRSRIEPPLPPLPGGDAVRSDEVRQDPERPQPPLEIPGVRQGVQPDAAPEPTPDTASRFAEAFAAFPEIGRTKFAVAEQAWPAVAHLAGGEDLLIDAVRAFARSPAAKAQEGRAVPSIATWLKRGDWKPHVPSARNAGEPKPSGWNGPEDVWTDVVAHIAQAHGGGDAGVEAGEAFAASYLRPCAWRDLPTPALVIRNGTIHQRLASRCGGLFRQRSIDLVLDAQGVAA